MRQLRWGLKAEFPYTKVFILGIILTLLGSSCVVVSVVGIIKLAWGYYVGTGMWGGVVVTVSGLGAMYAARAHTAVSARLYFLLAIMACLVSFAMLVLSAGGLTYKSNFYQPVRLDSEKHRVTLFLHGSVLGVAVLSLACNVLSVIVCCKFMKREKDRGEESFKLRRHRRRFPSDPNGVYRTGSLRGGSGTGTVRSSTSSRTPLFGSERSHKHSRQASGSDYNTSLKIPSDRASHRRDSDRSRGSSRSRQSHHRQSSSVSQQSRHSAMEAEVTTVLLRNDQANSLSRRREDVPARSVAENIRDSVADTLTDNVSVQLVFDPDEEPPPPYEEIPSATVPADCDADESDTETVDGSSNVVIPSSLPLNIPVTHIGGAVECQTQSLQRQPPPSGSARARPSPQRRVENIGAIHRNSSAANSPEVNNSGERNNRVNLVRVSERRPGVQGSPARQPAPQQADSSGPHPLEDRVGSPEICALTGARMTPVAAVQPDTVSGNNPSLIASQVPQVQHSPDSSDTSLPGVNVPAPQTPVTASRTQSAVTQPLSSNSPSALPAGIRSPNSAFRPVGRRMVPVAHGSPAHSSVPLHNFFSPISSPGSAHHHVVYSPVASPSSPRHGNHLASSSESLGRGASSQPMSWKKIPLPMSHNNHSNRTSSVPTKEVISKNIPGPAVPSGQVPDRAQEPQSQSLPRQSSRDAEKAPSAFNPQTSDKARSRFAPVPAKANPQRDPRAQFATVPVRRSQEGVLPISSQQCGPRHNSVDSVDSRAVAGPRSAFVGNRSGALGNHSTVVGVAPATTANSKPAPTSSRFNAVSKQTPATGSPKAASKVQATSTQLDPGRRSAGCQATEEDGGISSSMDRTHKWVLGTLPSGTRYQGVTKNMAHIHATSGAGTRQSAVARHGARTQGIWDRPNKAAAPVPTSSSAVSSQPVVPQPIRPVPGGMPSSTVVSSQPVVPQPVRPVPSSVSSCQPIVPQPIKATPANLSSPQLSKHASDRTLATQAIKSVPAGLSLLSITSSEPVAPQPTGPKPSIASSSLSSHAFKPPVPVSSSQPATSSKPIAPQPIRPKPSNHSSQPPIKPTAIAFSALSINPTQPSALQPVNPLAAALSSPGQKGPSSFSRLPRYQPVPPPRTREQTQAPQPLPRKQLQQPQAQGEPHESGNQQEEPAVQQMRPVQQLQQAQQLQVEQLQQQFAQQQIGEGRRQVSRLGGQAQRVQQLPPAQEVLDDEFRQDLDHDQQGKPLFSLLL